MQLRVVTWNLLHGRAVPGAGRDLFDEFATTLAGWEWDVALLQEVPPWWPGQLAAAWRAESSMVLTSRNTGLAARRLAARRWPDLMKSGGGGANAILCRSDRVAGERSARLCRRPEPRWVQAVDLACGVWIGNLHATAHDTPAAERDARLAGAAMQRWSLEQGGRPIVLGGDFNLRTVTVDGLRSVAANDVDHVLVGVDVVAVEGSVEILERGTLSDHAPVAVTLEVTLP